MPLAGRCCAAVAAGETWVAWWPDCWTGCTVVGGTVVGGTVVGGTVVGGTAPAPGGAKQSANGKEDDEDWWTE